MSKIICVTATSLLLTIVSLPTMASNIKFIAADKTKETQLCMHVVSNDLNAVKRSIRRYDDYGAKYAINTLKCNDLSLAKIAYIYQADETYKYLNKRTYQGNRVYPNVTINDLAKKANSGKKTIYIASTAK